MRCLDNENRAPNGLEENNDNLNKTPYTIGIKYFKEEDIVPLHHAKSIEILVCDNLQGQVIIDNNCYELCGNQVFVIPPYILHSNSIRICDGTLFVFQLSFTKMEQYMNIPGILASSGCRVDQLAYVCPDYTGVRSIMDALIQYDGSLCTCLPYVLQLFSLLSKYTDLHRENNRDDSCFNTASLQKIISWTQDNYMNKITIEKAAAMTGYSKYYFCSRFKALTGITYLNYLNSVRVSYACLRLQDGQSVQKVCLDCGFENVSYFIQVFKRIQRVTPYQYASKHRITESSHPN